MARSKDFYKIFRDESSAKETTTEYKDILEQVQKFCSKEHSMLIIDGEDTADSTAMLKSGILSMNKTCGVQIFLQKN